MDFTGELETHLTVAFPRTDDAAAATRTDLVDALRAWGETRGLKCTHIVLARGTSASQPMLTGLGCGPACRR